MDGARPNIGWVPGQNAPPAAGAPPAAARSGDTPLLKRMHLIIYRKERPSGGTFPYTQGPGILAGQSSYAIPSAKTAAPLFAKGAALVIFGENWYNPLKGRCLE